MTRPKGPEREQQQLMLTPDTREALAALANERGLTRSQMVEHLVREELQRKARRANA